ncbi:hypothetical protein L1787_16650 [Acuticoccus sp. M5D2P5]|uniref:helix-turn-helix domain-containing protein n=1 Tax=Acuticoccus kalidii TaxID=2910977 RepID=UPI001F17A1AB|nr:hypothetical protein [Acuticoccus kalidii]
MYAPYQNSVAVQFHERHKAAAARLNRKRRPVDAPTFAELRGAEPTASEPAPDKIRFDNAEDVLSPSVRISIRGPVEQIKKAVADDYELTVADLECERRTRRLVGPRQLAMYLAHILTPRSLPEIGTRFGGRDHTTVLNGIKKVEKRIASDAVFAELVESFKAQLTE